MRKIFVTWVMAKAFIYWMDQAEHIWLTSWCLSKVDLQLFPPSSGIYDSYKTARLIFWGFLGNLGHPTNKDIFWEPYSLFIQIMKVTLYFYHRTKLVQDIKKAIRNKTENGQTVPTSMLNSANYMVLKHIGKYGNFKF